MSRKIIIAGNWKMNKTQAETKAFVKEFIPLVAGNTSTEIVICPVSTCISAAAEAAKGSNVKIGAQNVHWAENGAFTGELSAAMLKDAGAEYVIIGHSERRQYFGETDETVNKRLKAALSAGLKPMVCVGEFLQEREGGLTEKVLDTQLNGGLAGLTPEQMEKVVIAYEPVWAIGTGKTATPAMAEETHAYIRKVLSKMFGAKTADSVRLQYGGSMKADNAKDLVAQPDIDGGLVGGASLKADDFASIVEIAAQVKGGR